MEKHKNIEISSNYVHVSLIVIEHIRQNKGRQEYIFNHDTFSKFCVSYEPFFSYSFWVLLFSIKACAHSSKYKTPPTPPKKNKNKKPFIYKTQNK